MADESTSLFSGGPLPPPLSKSQEARKQVRDAKWNAARALRDGMTDEEREAEQERLAREVEAMLAAREQDQRDAA